MKNPQDFSHPNPPNDIPATGAPLMGSMEKVWGLPWPRKPVSKAPKGKPGPRTTRSGVHRLGRGMKKKNY